MSESRFEAGREVWEVWQGNTLVCSAQMKLTEWQARNKVENELRNGIRMEARKASSWQGE